MVDTKRISQHGVDGSAAMETGCHGAEGQRGHLTLLLWGKKESSEIMNRDGTVPSDDMNAGC